MNTLSERVSQALVELGCDASLINPLDSQSPIVIDFIDLPSLLLAEDGQQVWIWCALTDYSHHVLQQLAAVILPELMKSDDTLVGGLPGLREREGMLELSGVLAPEALETSTALAQAINHFFDRVARLMELMDE